MELLVFVVGSPEVVEVVITLRALALKVVGSTGITTVRRVLKLIDVKHGKFTHWHENGQKEQEGRLDDIWVNAACRKMGSLVRQRAKETVKAQLTGNADWIHWYENGAKKSEGHACNVE